MFFYRLRLLLILLMAVGVTACDPRQMPGFKQAAKQQEERVTRETQDAIKGSPALQELDSLCTQEIPRPDGFVLVNQSRDFHEHKFLGYGYHATMDYKSVQHFYSTYFEQRGWRLTKQKDDGWGPPEIEFRNEKYQVTVYDMGPGAGENYGIVCRGYEVVSTLQALFPPANAHILTQPLNPFRRPINPRWLGKTVFLLVFFNCANVRFT